MKTLNLIAATGLVLASFAFTLLKTGGIQGKISPVEGSKVAVAISGRDTLRAPINSGSFKFSGLKAGTYTVLIKRLLPLTDTSIVNIPVIEDAITDVGTIRLVQ
jgi:hypothetical protein